MFCPNCGTQNSETATSCTKCGFQLKGAAAPRFKGTMLMSQQPPSAPPPMPAPPGAAPPPMPMPPPPALGGDNQGLAGTVIGVPPAGLGASAGPPGALPAPPPPPGYPPPAAAGYPAPPAPPGYPAPPAYEPPGGLGSTVAIDNIPGFTPPSPNPPGVPSPGAFPPPAGPPPGGGFGAAPPGGAYGPPQGGAYGPPPGGGGYGPPPGGDQGGYGAPQQQGGYGAPQQQGGYGAPQQQGGYGAPQQQGGFGAPQQQGGYGAPQQQGYGAPQQQGYGAPGGGMVPAGQYPGGGMSQGQMGAPMGGPMAMGTPGGMTAKGPIRSTTTVLLLTMFTCGIYPIFGSYSMLNELKACLRDDSLAPWHMFIPILNLLMVLKLPELVGRAKQMAGSRNPQPQGLVIYLLLLPYALAKDLNEIYDPSRTE
ncbi:zinc-ribbon domain-containing protein [Polyangium aurulentum]|nr:zinc-ribbon domain-containing protein [Polyangium aurulentum]